MTIHFLTTQIAKIRNIVPGYISAIATGASLTGTNMLVQVLLIPLYVHYLPESRFGFLMILLSICNFAAIGVGWLSGGLVRQLGECWANSDKPGFNDVFVVGKITFTAYATLVSIMGVSLWFLFQGVSITTSNNGISVLLAGAYLICTYEVLPERQAFIGANKQASGNRIEFLRILLFAGLTWIFLPKYPEVSTVIIMMLASVIFQRILLAFYWRHEVGLFGWGKFSSSMIPILKRLTGKQGLGYLSYGALLLVLQSDTILIGVVGGEVAAGQFVLLWKIPEALGLVLALIPATLTPRVIHLDATGDQHNLNVIFVKGRRYFLFITLLVSILYLFAGKWVATLWVGERAPDEWWMYAAGSAALFLTAYSRWAISFAVAVIKLQPLVKIASIELAFKIGMVVLLYPTLGIATPLLALIVIHITYASWAYQGIFRPKGNTSILWRAKKLTSHILIYGSNLLLGKEAIHRITILRYLVTTCNCIIAFISPVHRKQQKFEREHPNVPWLVPDSIPVIEDLLKENYIGFEWGSGRSTIWFAKRVSHITSVEGRKKWFDLLETKIENKNLNDKVDLVYKEVSSEHNFLPKEIDQYSSSIDVFPDDHFDFIVIDGHFRLECIEHALPKVRAGGYLIIDNSDTLPIDFLAKIDSEMIDFFTNGIWETSIIKRKG